MRQTPLDPCAKDLEIQGDHLLGHGNQKARKQSRKNNWPVFAWMVCPTAQEQEQPTGQLRSLRSGQAPTDSRSRAKERRRFLDASREARYSTASVLPSASATWSGVSSGEFEAGGGGGGGGGAEDHPPVAASSGKMRTELPEVIDLFCCNKRRIQNIFSAKVPQRMPGLKLPSPTGGTGFLLTAQVTFWIFWGRFTAISRGGGTG